MFGRGSPSGGQRLPHFPGLLPKAPLFFSDPNSSWEQPIAGAAQRRRTVLSVWVGVQSLRTPTPAAASGVGLEGPWEPEARSLFYF